MGDGIDNWRQQAWDVWELVQMRLVSPDTYLQAAIAGAAILLGAMLGAFLSAGARRLESRTSPEAFKELHALLDGARKIAVPGMVAATLGVTNEITLDVTGESWLVRAAGGFSTIVFIYCFVSLFSRRSAFLTVMKWIGVFIALLVVLGWLDEVILYLDASAIEAGNFKVSAYAVVRTFLFGLVLFWLGRLSNDTGQKVIRDQVNLDAGAREVMAKLFQISIYGLILIILINVMGVDLTALAVFGGALGIGLGLGLQQIAANFISGIIILLDRSITIGDYIELEDGKSGRVRAMNIRSTTLETFDGKDIVTPNEKFIGTAFTNWTHHNNKQRYQLRFGVAYKTDMDAMLALVKETVASHPQVLTGKGVPLAELPDSEIESFGDSAVNILVEFWMDGIDDGDNRVRADLLLMIWTALKGAGVEMPFPQREVKMVK